MNIELLKEKISTKFRTQEDFAESIGVARRTLQNWFSSGLVPNDKYFDILDSLDLEESEEEKLLNLPKLQMVFRAKHSIQASNDGALLCENIAESFLKLSSTAYQTKDSIPVLQKPFSIETITSTVRSIFSLEESSPVFLNDVLERLKFHNVSTIFFPFDKIGIDIHKQGREVAFTAVKEGKRIIFLDTNRKVDEVLFDLIHEVTHIVCGHIPETTTEVDEKLCNDVATEIIYPKLFFVKNVKMTEHLKHCSKYPYNQVKEWINLILKDLDWSAMGIALALERYEYFAKSNNSFKRLMGINAQIKKLTQTVDQMYFENFNTDNFEAMLSFFKSDIYKSRDFYNGFIELKNGAIYGHISPSRLAEILRINKGDADELVKKWVMEDSEEVEHEEGLIHDQELE